MNKSKHTRTSFGKYFDDQRDRLEKAMRNKNAQQNIEWMEDYEKRQAKKQEQTRSIKEQMQRKDFNKPEGDVATRIALVIVLSLIIFVIVI